MGHLGDPLHDTDDRVCIGVRMRIPRSAPPPEDGSRADTPRSIR
jgi:hypothetical protein